MRDAMRLPIRAPYPFMTLPMAITKAIGLGIGIIVLKLLLPNVLSEIEQTAIAFLNGAQTGANVASTLAASAGDIRFSNEPFVLTQAPLPGTMVR